VVRWVASEDWTSAATALRRLRSTRALGRQRGVGLLQRGQYQVLSVDAPTVPREEWKQALRWQLKDLVAFPIEDASIDLLELPAAPAAHGHARLLAVAAAQAEMQPLTRAGEDAGTPWQAVDIPETALRNISALVEPAARAQALLHVADHGLLVITVGGELAAARTIDVSAAQLASDDAGQRQQAFDRAGLELQRTLDSFERQFSHLSLARLLVTPGAHTPALCAYLRELVYPPVEPLDIGDTLDLSAVPELADPLVCSTYLCAIGAALREG
jgi:MSHA biogenesis protein MshI